MSLQTLDLYLSGGAANANPNASLGGLKSSVKLLGQTLAYSATAMAGVTLVDAAGVVAGTLHFVKTGNYLGFQKTGGAVPTTAQSVVVGADGTYTLECPELGQFVAVTVVFASLPGANSTATVVATSINQNLFDDVLATEAEVGKVEYRHFYIQNNTASTVLANLFIQQQFTGLDYLEIGVYQLTSGNVDQLLANETSVPANVTFYLAGSSADGFQLTINASGFLGVYLKRTVTALSDSGTPSDTAIIVLEVRT